METGVVYIAAEPPTECKLLAPLTVNVKCLALNHSGDERADNGELKGGIHGNYHNPLKLIDLIRAPFDLSALT